MNRKDSDDKITGSVLERERKKCELFNKTRWMPLLFYFFKSLHLVPLGHGQRITYKNNGGN